MLEAECVDLVRLGVQDVAGGTALQPVGPERLPEPRDIGLQGAPGGVGRLVAPDVVDQGIRRDQPVGVNEQVGQYETLLRPSERNPTPPVEDLEGPEDPKLHRRTVLPVSLVRKGHLRVPFCPSRLASG